MSTEGEDFDLLREYVANQSETAFRTLVERHVDMVYATALRQVGDAHLAEEATQAVFITLARKARGLSSSTILAGWLFRAAQFAAAKVQRTELRRKHWEQQAAQMEPITSDSAAAWDQMAPQLNEALNELTEPDRDALILRFFESKSMAQVGSALGTSEGAAKMRVARALDQLRGIFQARGTALPVTLLAAALSASATQAAPVGLAATITTSALLKSTTIPLLTKGLLLFMNWNARKLAITAIIVLSLSTVATTSVVAVLLWKQSRPVAGAPAAPPPQAEQEVVLGLNDSGGLNFTPGKDGTLRVKTADGDFIVTNGVNHIVTTDDQGHTKEITIATDENGGGRRMTVRSFRGAAGGPPTSGAGGGPVRVRGEAGPGTRG
ncbi:MAG TPA: sigma-70 family RNA polymerase sigma factor, partial [Candidatus Limnocylindria bacterium]|nr:sigma-70 family RNA polymerase sigma factor [Candidatus Limnocylindria bacterium]